MSVFQLPRLRVGQAVLPAGAVPDGTRRRILEVALRLFVNEGFHGTSIRDIAKILELPPSGLYTHFKSKDHVLAELARVGHEAHAATLRDALNGVGDDPVDQLRALVRAHTVMHATYPHLAVIVNEEIRSLTKELAAPALEVRARSSAILLHTIERGIAMGRFNPPHAMTTAAAIAAMGLRIPYWYESTEHFDIEALAESHVELSLRMLGLRDIAGKQ